MTTDDLVCAVEWELRDGVAGQWVTLAESDAPSLCYRLWCGPFGSPEPVPSLARRFAYEHPALWGLPPPRALLHFVGWLICHYGFEVVPAKA